MSDDRVEVGYCSAKNKANLFFGLQYRKSKYALAFEYGKSCSRETADTGAQLMSNCFEGELHIAKETVK